MDSKTVVADSGIFIEYLRSKNKQKTALHLLSSDNEIQISVVTLYELLMGATNERKRTDIQILTEDLLILPFDKAVAKKAAEIYHHLRQKNKMIEFRDIFIAATCIFYDLPIKTLNKKHFERIPKIRFV